jgi:hypothetical protein
VAPSLAAELRSVAAAWRRAARNGRGVTEEGPDGSDRAGGDGSAEEAREVEPAR